MTAWLAEGPNTSQRQRAGGSRASQAVRGLQVKFSATNTTQTACRRMETPRQHQLAKTLTSCKCLLKRAPCSTSARKGDASRNQLAHYRRLLHARACVAAPVCSFFSCWWLFSGATVCVYYDVGAPGSHTITDAAGWDKISYRRRSAPCCRWLHGAECQRSAAIHRDFTPRPKLAGTTDCMRHRLGGSDR